MPFFAFTLLRSLAITTIGMLVVTIALLSPSMRSGGSPRGPDQG